MGILDRSPRRLTYDDYVLIPEDGLRHEIVDGVHVVNPSPSWNHQRVVGAVFRELQQGIEEAGLGLVVMAPFDVRLGDHDIVQPDVLAIASGREEQLHPQYLQGPPSLVVEVLSPSTVRHDRGAKLAAYDRAGVEEVWMVDPTRRRAERWSRSPGSKLRREGEFEQTLPSVRFLGVSLGLFDLWTQLRF